MAEENTQPVVPKVEPSVPAPEKAVDIRETEYGLFLMGQGFKWSSRDKAFVHKNGGAVTRVRFVPSSKRIRLIHEEPGLEDKIKGEQQFDILNADAVQQMLTGLRAQLTGLPRQAPKPRGPKTVWNAFISSIPIEVQSYAQAGANYAYWKENGHFPDSIKSFEAEFLRRCADSGFDVEVERKKPIRKNKGKTAQAELPTLVVVQPPVPEPATIVPPVPEPVAEPLGPIVSDIEVVPVAEPVVERPSALKALFQTLTSDLTKIVPFVEEPVVEEPIVDVPVVEDLKVLAAPIPEETPAGGVSNIEVARNTSLNEGEVVLAEEVVTMPEKQETVKVPEKPSVSEGVSACIECEKAAAEEAKVEEPIVAMSAPTPAEQSSPVVEDKPVEAVEAAPVVEPVKVVEESAEPVQVPEEVIEAPEEVIPEPKIYSAEDAPAPAFARGDMVMVSSLPKSRDKFYDPRMEECVGKNATVHGHEVAIIWDDDEQEYVYLLEDEEGFKFSNYESNLAKAMSAPEPAMPASIIPEEGAQTQWAAPDVCSTCGSSNCTCAMASPDGPIEEVQSDAAAAEKKVEEVISDVAEGAKDVVDKVAMAANDDYDMPEGSPHQHKGMPEWATWAIGIGLMASPFVLSLLMKKKDGTQ